MATTSAVRVVIGRVDDVAAASAIVRVRGRIGTNAGTQLLGRHGFEGAAFIAWTGAMGCETSAGRPWVGKVVLAPLCALAVALGLDGRDFDGRLALDL